MKRYLLFLMVVVLALVLFSCAKPVNKTFYNGTVSIEFPDTTIDFSTESAFDLGYNKGENLSAFYFYGYQYDSTNAYQFSFNLGASGMFVSGNSYVMDHPVFPGGSIYVNKSPVSGSYDLNSATIIFDDVLAEHLSGKMVGNFTHSGSDYIVYVHFDFY